MTLPVPTIGRIVLVKLSGYNEPLPAIITAVTYGVSTAQEVKVYVFGYERGHQTVNVDSLKLDQTRTYDNTWSWMDYQVQTVCQLYPDAPKEIS